MNPANDAFEKRRIGFEEAFFKDRDQKLMEKMRSELAAMEEKKKLAHVTGIVEERVLASLVQAGVGAETMTAVSLAPMIEVAWCDGKAESAEKAAVLRGAAEIGLEFESPLYKFLESWLDTRPSPAALQAWHSYVRSFVKLVEPATAAKVKENVMGRAERVAKAAGGFMGFGDKISDQEHACLNDLAKAFDSTE